MSNVICPYPASCMGKTVKNKSLLLIYTTINMPELGVTAGIVAVSPITNYTSTEIAHMPMPESKRGGCKDSCYLEITRAQTKEKLYTYSYQNVFFWRLRILISGGSFCWIISMSGNKNGFCLSLVFSVTSFKFPYARKHNNKKHKFWGTTLEKRNFFLCFWITVVHVSVQFTYATMYLFYYSATVRGWIFKSSRMKLVVGWELTWYNLAKNKILWFRYKWLKK